MVGHLELVAELTVPAEPELLTVCRTTLAGVVAALPMSDAALDDLKLVLSEVCGEAMERIGTAGGSVAIEFRRSSDELEVCVIDHGQEQATGGLAAPLLRRLCSRLEVSPGAAGAGRVVRFAQTLPA